jgi:hypothetical protein
VSGASWATSIIFFDLILEIVNRLLVPGTKNARGTMGAKPPPIGTRNDRRYHFATLCHTHTEPLGAHQEESHTRLKQRFPNQTRNRGVLPQVVRHIDHVGPRSVFDDDIRYGCPGARLVRGIDRQHTPPANWCVHILAMMYL